MKTFDRTEIQKASMLNRHALYCDRWGIFVFDTPNTYDKEFALVTEGPKGPSAPQGFGSHLAMTGRTYTAASVCATVQYLNGRIHRDELKWGGVESIRGTYSFPGSNAQIQKLADFCNISKDYGIEPYIVLDSGNANYGFDSPVGYKGGLPLDSDELEGYSNYCGWIVSQVPKVTKFELWNEFNIDGLSTPQENTDNAGAPPERYINLIKAAYPKIKAARPDAEVIVGTFTDPYWQDTLNSQWMHSILQMGAAQYSTAFSIHHYNGFLRPEYWHDQLYRVIELIRQYAPMHKVYLSESGWFNGTDASSITEAEAAARYSRYPFLLRCLDFSGTTFYSLANDGTDAAKESNFGFYTLNLGASKAQASTVKDALAHVNEATSAKHYSDASLMRRVVLMDTATGQRAACWSITATGTTTLSVFAQSAGTLSIQTMGSTTATQAINPGLNSVAVSLSDTAKVVFADVPITISTQ